eukprot:898767-Prymnesium_polylepis.2
MNAAIGETVHCLAAEPHAVILRVSIADARSDLGREVAFETVVLARLQRGYRVLQLRSMFGTRIELAYLFVRIAFGDEPNMFATSRQ